MSNERERNAETDRLIRGALARAAADARFDACLDAEAIAAWTEGGLDAASASRAEAHLSSCAACQALLATLVRTEPTTASAVPVVVPFWQRWSLRWAIPALAGVSAVLLWTLQGVPAPEDAAIDMATERQLPAPALPSEAPAPEAVSKEADTPGRAAEPRPEPRGVAVPSEARAASPPVPAAAVATGNAAVAPTSPAASAVAPQASAAATDVRSERLESTLQVQGERSFALSAEPAFQAGRAVDQALLQRSALATTAFEFAVALPPAAASNEGAEVRRAEVGVAGGRGRAGVAAAPTSIPTAPVRWRVMSNGTVERMIAGGTAWEPVAAFSPAALTAGAAPSPLVCWLVGRGGAVSRTINGRTFQSVPVPVAVDLVAVSAVSANAARVTAADGRTFTTTDGGLTWQ